MATLSHPSEIAREALRLLAARRLVPSPENYRILYHEIAGTAAEPCEPSLEQELKTLLAALPRGTTGQQRIARRIEHALQGKTWVQVRDGLADLVLQLGKEAELPWSELFGEFLRAWENRQTGATPARKRETLERMLAGGSAASGEIFFTRLQGLIRSWSLHAAIDQEGAPIAAVVADSATTAADLPAAASSSLSEATALSALAVRAFAELCSYALEVLVGSQLGDEIELAAAARALAHKARTATSQAAIDALLVEVKRFAFRLELLAEDRGELRAGLLSLLQLLVENVGELVVEDRWLKGQIDIVREIVSQPLSVRAISDAESRLKEVIFKQSRLKLSLNDAKESLKQMLAGFVDHLAEFADSTSDYHDKIEVYAQRISQADDIAQLEDVLGEVMHETRMIQLNAQRSRDELRAARQRVDEAEKRITEMQSELDKTSMLVRHDQLTGALNRRGLQEAFDREKARAKRRQTDLCIALLDIDNFKKLNDSLGHDAGDAALVHLATVIRETMRPQDTVARFGGEEFVILLPDTSIEQAQKAMTRLQRELTRRFFLHDNNRQLITFSAGVTDFRVDDDQETLTKRADQAMYAAKRSGKNRVLVG